MLSRASGLGRHVARLAPAARSPAAPRTLAVSPAVQHCWDTRGARSMSDVASFMSAPTTALAQSMKENGTRRASVLFNYATGKVEASHECVQPLADFMNADETDMLDHEGLFLELGRESGQLMGAFLWKTLRGQGCGGIRFLPYDCIESYVRDGMRLALGMGRKSALAGLWWGGGKGVIARDDTVTDANREAVFRDYGDFLTGLRGCYVAAEDAGVNVSDVDVVFSHTRHTTCISPSLGGSGNPSVPTAAGVVAAMEGALDFMGKGTLEGKTVAIQGVGNVGLPMAGFLLEKGVAGIVATDKDTERVQFALETLNHDSRVQIHTSDDCPDLLYQDVDIVSPCGFGAILNADSIPKIKAPIVCGAANNQLQEPADATRVQDAGIVYVPDCKELHTPCLLPDDSECAHSYVPDFVANRMGMYVFAYGRIGANDAMVDPAITRHFDKGWENSVFNITKSVLQLAADTGATTADAANKLADEAAAQPHPIWGHRSRDIVASLIADDWAHSAPVE